MRIGVFLSSSSNLAPQFVNEASQLGRLIGERKHELVYGDGGVGNMDVLAIAAKEAGAKVHGVLPLAFSDVRGYADVHYQTRNLRDRQDKMDELSEGFIALAGGFGTWYEIFDMVTHKQTNFNNKPIALVGRSFYRPINEIVRRGIAEGTIKTSEKELYKIVDTPLEAIYYLENYVPKQRPNKVKEALESHRLVTSRQ
jgi:uncharacterized protein (TIGR00730 family)